jgi:DNA-binding response OmpR family regulator
MSRLDTILVADDDPDLRDLIAATLAIAGYAVLAAADGYDAVRVLADNWVNLLIADIRMPSMDGFELARQAKVMRPNLHVIYISQYSLETAKRAGPIYGPVLKKPILMEHLLEEVKRQLS